MIVGLSPEAVAFLSPILNPVEVEWLEAFFRRVAPSVAIQ